MFNELEHYNLFDLLSIFLKTTIIVGISWSLVVWILNFHSVSKSVYWKLFDYLWFGTAALGIFSLCVTFDRFTSDKIYQTYFIPEIKNQYKSLHDSFKAGENRYCSLNSIFTDLKPPTSNLLESDPISMYNLCKYFKNTFSNMPNPSLLQEPYKRPSEMNIVPYEFLLEKQCYNRLESQVDSQIYYYDEIIVNAEKLKKNMELPTYYPKIQWILKIFGSLLGFRLSKVTAELKDIRREMKISKINTELKEREIKKEMPCFILKLIDYKRQFFISIVLCTLAYVIYFL